MSGGTYEVIGREAECNREIIGLSEMDLGARLLIA